MKKLYFILICLSALFFQSCRNINGDQLNESEILRIDLNTATYKHFFAVGETPTLVGAELIISKTDGTFYYVTVTEEMTDGVGLF